VPKRRPQHLPNDAIGHFHLDAIYRLAVHRLIDLLVLRTSVQRRTVESAADAGRDVFEVDTL